MNNQFAQNTNIIELSIKVKLATKINESFMLNFLKFSLCKLYFALLFPLAMGVSYIL